MYVDKTLAIRLETCFKQMHIAVSKQYSQSDIFEIKGGAACFSDVDSYLSQIVGWGFATNPEHFLAEILALESFYKSVGNSRVDIEFCPYMGAELAELLTQRSYHISELNTVSVMDLAQYEPSNLAMDGFVVQQLVGDELALWVDRVATGFEAPDAVEQFSHYVAAEGVVVFAVFKEGEFCAGAALAAYDGVCDLALSSVLPHFRDKGLHKLLLLTRLNYAKAQGLELAMVTTEPGTISDLNVQKVGFHPAYNRIKLTSYL